jgi:hypothetical protein
MGFLIQGQRPECRVYDKNGHLKRWTSDGNGLLITGVDNKGRPGLFRVDAHTGATSVVGSLELGKEWPDDDWKVSADAATLYFRGGRVSFYRRDVATGIETELIHASEMGYINLSPDDQYIATAVTDPATNSRTFVVIPTTKGGRPRELMRLGTGNSDGETGPNGRGRALGFGGCSADSRFVLIRETLNGKPVAVWRASLDGTAPHRLDWGADQLQGRGPLAIHPKALGSRTWNRQNKTLHRWTKSGCLRIFYLRRSRSSLHIWACRVPLEEIGMPRRNAPNGRFSD